MTVSTTMSNTQLVELANLLGQSLHPDSHLKATKQLNQLEQSNPEYAKLLLQLITLQTVQPHIQLAASTCFKNFIKRNWELTDGEPNIISEPNREFVKSVILNLMICVPTTIQLQLSETVGIIASFDFPHNWANLIPDLVSKLSPDNYVTNIGVLQTAHPIFKRWRHKYQSDALYTEINYVINSFCTPYLAMFLETDQRLSQAIDSKNQPQYDLYMQALLLMAKIFYSFNIQDLPAFFEDHQAQFFQVFIKYLHPTSACIVNKQDDDDDDDPSLLDKLQTVICEIAIVYCDKYAEDWKAMDQVILAIWQLLTHTGPGPRFDLLVSKALSLLTTVVRRPSHLHSFSNEQTLASIVHQIVIPNIKLRNSDLDLFADEPVEFIRRDLEASDADTRRKSASNLVKGLLDQFAEPVQNLCVQWINQSMHRHEQLTQDQVLVRDAACALFMAVATKSHLSSKGIASTHMDPIAFFTTHLLIDLQADSGLLTVSALKFIHMFRQQLNKDQHLQTIPMIAHHLCSMSYVVSTWAAVVLDVQLTQIFKPTEIQPALIDDIYARVSHVILNEHSPQKVQERDLVLRVLYRCIQHQLKNVPGVMQTVMHGLNLTVTNPVNPKFSHNSFECIAMLIRNVCTGSNVSLVTEFEQFLLPVFSSILASDVAEFAPYVYQILTQLLQLHTDSIPDTYTAMLPAFLVPQCWESHGNVPALVPLMQAYLQKCAPLIVKNNQLQSMLGVFQKLINSRATEKFGFDLLFAIFMYTDVAALDIYRKTVLTLLLTRLNSGRVGAAHQKFVVLFIQFLGFYLCVNPSTDLVVSSFDQVQHGVFQQLVQPIVVPNLVHLVGPYARRLVMIGFTRLLTNVDTCKQFPAQTLQSLVVELVRFSACPDLHVKPALDQEGMEDDLDLLAYQAGYSKLNAIRGLDLDPVPALLNVSGQKYLVAQWPELLQNLEGVLKPVLASVSEDMTKLQNDVASGRV